MQRKAFTIIELLIVTCVFLIMAVVLTPFVQTTKAHANRINCANNLRQISLGLHKYALDHRGSFPENLGALYPNYVSDGATLDCPGRKSAGIKNGPDYIYMAGLTEASGPEKIIVQDSDTNHAKSGKNIVKVDGSIEWISVAR